MDEHEDISQQQQDAINAALEIAAAAAAAAQQQPNEGDDNGTGHDVTEETEIREQSQAEYINEDGEALKDEVQPELIQSNLDVEQLTSFDHNQVDASEQLLVLPYKEDSSYEVNERGELGQGDIDSEQIESIESNQELRSEQVAGEEVGDYSHASNSMADINQSQVHENIPVNQFEQPDADQSGFNDLASSSQPTLHHTAQQNRTLSHHSKRRKINTCLPCKRRKVKCDREKPHCGQCKKSQIPEHECTWSAAVEHPMTTNGLPSAVPFPPSSEIISNNGSNGQWVSPNISGTNWNGVSPNPQATGSVQLLLERIAVLEGLLTTHGRRGTNGEGNQWSEEKAVNLAGDARGIAADALAMIAQQSSNNILPLSNGHSKVTYKKLFTNSNFQWPSSSSGSSRTKDSIRLLPESKGLYGAIRYLDAVQEHGIFVGLFSTLVEGQLTTFISQIENSSGQIPLIDLSLIALLFYILAVSVDLMSVEQTMALEVAENEEAIVDLIDVWTQTADSILLEAEFESKPNLNLLSTLLLKRQIQASRGNVNAASITLGMCIRLSRAMGVDKIGTQREDITQWESSPKTQIDNVPTVIHLDQFMEPILMEGCQLEPQLISRTSWLSLRCAAVREAARQVYAHLAIQEWIADSLPSLSILPSEQISLPLPVQPSSLKDGYSLNVETDDTKASSIQLLRYIFALSHIIAQWKRDVQTNTSCAEVERTLLFEPRPTFLQIDFLPSAEEVDPTRAQHMRLIAELVQQYCLFMVRRTDNSMIEQSIDAAERIMQTRSLLGSDFLSPLHKFFPIQRYTLEAAVLVVIYLHQYTAHISEERRQSLQALIDDTYAQPGYEHAHSLLSLSFDVIQAPPEEPSSINGTKRPAPDDDDEEEDGDNVNPNSGLSSVELNPIILGGMVLSNGNRLASSHPIVVGLRSFVNGQSLPIGSTTEIMDFWDAMQRYCHLFLVG